MSSGSGETAAPITLASNARPARNQAIAADTRSTASIEPVSTAPSTSPARSAAAVASMRISPCSTALSSAGSVSVRQCSSSNARTRSAGALCTRANSAAARVCESALPASGTMTSTHAVTAARTASGSRSPRGSVLSAIDPSRASTSAVGTPLLPDTAMAARYGTAATVAGYTEP